MRTVIAGSRTITDYAALEKAIANSGFMITSTLNGDADGVDFLGEIWAWINGIHTDDYPAKWQKYGKRAGVIRNSEMAANADALVAVWDGESRGTANMIECALQQKLHIYVYNLKEW